MRVYHQVFSQLFIFPPTIEPGEALTEIPPGIISLYDDILQVEKGNDQNISHYKVCCANDMNR